MNMKTDFQNLASELINDVFSDIAVDLTYRSLISSTYDPVSGDIITSYNDIPLKGILGPFSRDLIDAQEILLTDTRCVIPFQSLNGVEPRAQVDTLITVDGIEYDILQVLKDASEAAYTLQLRVTK